MTARRIEYTVRVQRDDDGSLWAEVRELPGCFVFIGYAPDRGDR